ncbi:MAG: tail fiber domain-containing protein, partial [Candidatus Margulisiibacteriota bacterium]
GKTSLANTYGVLGYEDVGIPTYAGVYAQAVDSDSYGIYANSSGSAGSAGYFNNQANSGRAIFARTEASSGINYAVSAQSQTANDYAVFASAGNGGTGLYGASSSSTGYALRTGTGRVQLAGNTGVGTDNPQAKLHVTGTTGAVACLVDGRVKMTNLAPAGAGTTLIITSTLEIVPQSSSRRYKKEIVDYQIDSAKLDNLRPVRFKWNDVSATPNQPDFGLIAEEVVKVYPELVALNQNGSPESVAYDKIGVILIKVLQEKNKEIEALKVRLKALEDKIK